MDEIVAVGKVEKAGRISHLWEKVTGACTAAFVALTASNSFAAETVTDLFTEVTTQTAGAKTGVYTFILFLVGVGVLLFGWKLLRRMGVAA